MWKALVVTAAVCWVLGVVLPPALAQTGGMPPVDCTREDLPQQEMNICAAQDYRRVDAELNRLYRLLVKQLSTSRRAKLVKAQLAWLSFRDGQCDFESARFEGGTIQPLIHANCMAVLTRIRNQQLAAELD